MKYVVLRHEGKALTRDIPFIFPNELVHQDVAVAMQRHLAKDHELDTYAVSAGDFCPITGICSGGSETLDMESRGDEDTRLIAAIDYGAGLQ